MAWNDPQWGKNNNSGPPDLDEMMRKLNQRLSQLFGGKGSGEAGGGSSGGGVPKNLLGVILAVVVAIWLASGFYIVDAGTKGVVLRFGEYTETTDPGARWHLPWPIESSQIVNMDQVRTVEIGYEGSVKNKKLSESLMLTDDENIIDLQFAVQFIVNDAENYLFNNRFVEDTEIVRQVAETAMREVVGTNKMDFVLYEGRSEVAAQARVIAQKILDRYKTGILISQVTLQNAQPPEEVQAAFDDAVKAGQDRERLKNEAQAYANDVIPRASGVASRLLEEAEGYRQSVISTAQGDASRFTQIFAEYKKAPQVTRKRIYLDTMQQVLSATPKVIVDQKGGNNLLYLPLDKLQQIVSQPYASAPEVLNTPPSTPPAPMTGGVDSRSRDAQLSRDRESRP
jgi:membrane protease subunit HflK